MLFAFGCALAANPPAAQASVTVPSQTYTSLAAFEAAVGGADNGTNPGEQGSGFRHFTPAGIAVNGSDPGSTAIPGGHTAALAPSRLQPWGIELGPDVAVANDGFASVNPNVDFSQTDLWAPFNSNSTTFQVVVPGAQTSSATPAFTRGLGVQFVNVESGTTIQYYSGNAPLFAQPLQVTTSFEGVLFADPVVTSVVITLGTDQIFNFDGSTVTAVGASGTMTAGDDVVLAEPGAGESSAAATAGVPVGLNLASFQTNDGATATIDWGDGSQGTGTLVGVQGEPGTFVLQGSHSYALPGSYTARATVEDVSGSAFETEADIQVAPRASTTAVTCSPAAVAVSATTLCVAAVSDSSPGTPTAPTGVVTFSSPTAGGSFPTAGSCTLGATAVPGTSMCVVQFEPSQRPPLHAAIIGVYRGDSLHTASQSATTVAVEKQRCSLSALSRRLRPGGFGLLVTCDARANVQVSAQAHVARSGPFRAFALAFGSGHLLITPGRPTVMVIRSAPGVLGILRAALGRGQRVSLKLTLTATSHATRTTTTKRVSAIRAF
ncbi:MAG TPA: hypothetical protein VME22_27995 [Solirubrobacteraceae bacterium]|nr:hypothetical protein [Solirubrobacteraceae bacterium]